MCAKIGGEPWAISEMPYFDDMTMVCGLDVYHNTAIGKRSILAFCASYNQRATKFWSATRVQQNVGEELSNELEQIFKGACEQFKEKNGKFPKKIIIYRDGVGQGQ